MHRLILYSIPDDISKNRIKPKSDNELEEDEEGGGMKGEKKRVGKREESCSYFD